MAKAPQWLQSVLEDYSCERYHVEHHGYRYNHIAMVAISLYHLGCSADEVIDSVKDYIKFEDNLEPVRLRPNLKPPIPRLMDSKELKELLGQRKNFLGLTAHFRRRLSVLGNDLDLFIQTELPVLSPALAASALHAHIQLGYGYSIRDCQLVSEAIAYYHFGYLPQVVSSEKLLTACLGQGSMDFIDVLREVKADGELLDYMTQNLMPFEDDRHRSILLRRIHTLLIEKGDELLAVVGKIKLPDWFNKERVDPVMATRIADWMIDKSIEIYALSELRNNLFLIHNVTGSWATRQVLPILKDKDDILRVISYTLSFIVAIYVTERCPQLSEKMIGDLIPESWENIKRVHATEDLEAHNYKLVHVCHERYQALNNLVVAREEVGANDSKGHSKMNTAFTSFKPDLMASLGDDSNSVLNEDELFSRKMRHICHVAAHISTYIPQTRDCPT